MGAQWKAKHKDLAANAKGRLFGKLAKDIMIAARHGADPAANSRLRLVIEQARKVSMPKDTLDRAIKKGAGLTGESVNFEHVVYEGFAPHRVPVMVECLTDNVNRAASDMRVLFRKGQLGTSGSVAWDFDHLGMIEAELTDASAGADPELAAIEAGAPWGRFSLQFHLQTVKHLGGNGDALAHTLGDGAVGLELAQHAVQVL